MTRSGYSQREKCACSPARSLSFGPTMIYDLSQRDTIATAVEISIRYCFARFIINDRRSTIADLRVAFNLTNF